METNEKLSFQESLYIGGSPEAPKKSVTVNGRNLPTKSHWQSIALLVAAYLCFNLAHPKKQEPVLEAIEGLIGIRKNYISTFVKLFVGNF